MNKRTFVCYGYWMKNITEAAQKYIVNKGWAVIPANIELDSKGDKIVKIYSKYWSKDEDVKGLDDVYEVEKVFRGKTAIGVVTGFRSGITIIDLDKNKITGELGTPLEAFPKTYTVKTRAGGYHLYYQYCAEMVNDSNIGGDKYPNLDCRNDGGFAFAPPSQINGEQAYFVERDMEVQPFPIDHFKDIKKSKENLSHLKGIQALKSFQGMAEGERDKSLFTYAEHLYRTSPRKDWPQADLSIQLMNKQMKLPMSEDQVIKIMKSARGYQSEAEKELDLVTNSKGEPTLEIKNAVTLLKGDTSFYEGIRANTFAGTIEYMNNGKWDVIKKSNETMLRVAIANKYPFAGKMPKAHIEDSIALIATENQISPIAEYFKSLKWDKKPRLNMWISKVFYVEDNPYYQQLGHHYLVGLVNRVIKPGCQMDNAIVLDGNEGFGKSQALRALCTFPELGTLFHETTESPDGKDFAIGLLGSLITEFAEGAVFDYRDRKKVKSFISKISDKYRPPYERAALDFPRQGVFAMSTNDSQYLEDNGINRRWWPVVIDRDDEGLRAPIAWLEENREQLFAEAMEKIDEGYWEFSPEAQKILNELREDKKVGDEMHAPIYEWYIRLDENTREKGVTKSQGFDQLRYNRDVNDLDLKKVGEYYVNTLHLKFSRRLDGDKKRRVFVPTKKTPKYDPELPELTTKSDF